MKPSKKETMLFSSTCKRIRYVRSTCSLLIICCSADNKYVPCTRKLCFLLSNILKPTSLNFVAGKIQISDSSKQLLDQFGMYDVSCRGEIPIKVISDIAHEIFDRP